MSMKSAAMIAAIALVAVAVVNRSPARKLLG